MDAEELLMRDEDERVCLWASWRSTAEDGRVLNPGDGCVCRGRAECELGSWRQLAPVNKPAAILTEGRREKRSAVEEKSKPVANLFHLGTLHTHRCSHYTLAIPADSCHTRKPAPLVNSEDAG